MFEAVLSGRPPSPSRSLAAPAAIALHVVALGAVVASSAWKVGDVPYPSLPIVFVDQAVPPPLGDPSGTMSSRPAHHPPPTVEKPPVVPIAAVVPETIPSTIPAIPPPALDLGGVSADAGGDAGPTWGDPHGVPGGPGVVGGPGEEGAPIPATAPDVVPPRLVSRPQPDYPEAARRLRLEGLVVLQAVIGLDGAVEDVRLISSSSPLFVEAALASVRQWRYAPATMNGRAVRVYLSATLKFTLH